MRSPATLDITLGFSVTHAGWWYPSDEVIVLAGSDRGDGTDGDAAGPGILLVKDTFSR